VETYLFIVETDRKPGRLYSSRGATPLGEHRGLDIGRTLGWATNTFCRSENLEDADRMLSPGDPEDLIFIPGKSEMLFGLTLSSGSTHLLRSVCQGIVFYYYDLFDRPGGRYHEGPLYVCGRVFSMQNLCSMFSYVFNLPLTRLEPGYAEELTALLTTTPPLLPGNPEAFRRILSDDRNETLLPDFSIHNRYKLQYKRYSSLRRDTILNNEG
jgi:sugar (pentulose or hexulose) kinase